MAVGKNNTNSQDPSSSAFMNERPLGSTQSFYRNLKTYTIPLAPTLILRHLVPPFGAFKGHADFTWLAFLKQSNYFVQTCLPSPRPSFSAPSKQPAACLYGSDAGRYQGPVARTLLDGPASWHPWPPSKQQRGHAPLIVSSSYHKDINHNKVLVSTAACIVCQFYAAFAGVARSLPQRLSATAKRQLLKRQMCDSKTCEAGSRPSVTRTFALECHPPGNQTARHTHKAPVCRTVQSQLKRGRHGSSVYVVKLELRTHGYLTFTRQIRSLQMKLDLQSTQNTGLKPKMKGMWFIILGHFGGKVLIVDRGVEFIVVQVSQFCVLCRVSMLQA